MKVKVLKSYVYVAETGRIVTVQGGQVIEVSNAEGQGLIARGKAVAVEPEVKPTPAQATTPKPVTPKRKVV